MRPFSADLHVHLGRTGTGLPVKMGAASGLTLRAALAAAPGHGLDIVGIVDCVTGGVLPELTALVNGRELIPLAGGGLRHTGGSVLIPGAEVEIATAYGASHHVGLFPGLESLADFARWLGERVSNPSLSTQRVAATAGELQAAIRDRGGLHMIAHAFTPYKGLLGGAPSLASVLPSPPDALELGLSADTALADRLPELAAVPYLTNSDAHGLGALAREVNVIAAEGTDFGELVQAVRGQEGRALAGNIGLDPRLGKYHRTACAQCGWTATGTATTPRCPECGRRAITGVKDRILHLSEDAVAASPPGRPPYTHIVPVDHLPGFGPAARRALAALGPEREALLAADAAALAAAVGARRAETILKARRGELDILPGGAGRPGRVVT